MNYDAITLGERDFLHGTNFLLDLQKELKLPFVSANIFYEENNKPVFSPFIIKKLKNFRHGDTTIPEVSVGIFGVMLYRNQLIFDKGEPNLIVGDPIEAAKKVVAEMKDKCDIIVCLAHLRYNELQPFAEAVPEVDVLLAGHDPVMRMEPMKIHESIALAGGNKGQYVGDLRLIIKNNSVFDYEGHVVTLDDKFKDDPEMTDFIKDFKEKEMKLTFKINRRRSRNMDMYAGTEVCKKCHEPQFKQWEKTGHAHAFARLKKDDQHKNYECVPCHTTGFARYNGFYTYDETPEMADVQCEACHGIGKLHVSTAEKLKDKKQAAAMLAPISEYSCSNCHTTERDPNFDFKKAVDKVKH